VGIAEGTGDMVAEINGLGAVFYLSNHRGDTMAAYCNLPYDPPLIAKYRYDAFGNQRANYCVVNESAHAPRFLFSTKEYLSDAELYLMRIEFMIQSLDGGHKEIQSTIRTA